MKIGILSMQRVINYGSFWQAYLLKRLLASRGNIIDFIDIIAGQRLIYQKKSIISRLRLKKIPFKIFFEPKRIEIFKNFTALYLECWTHPNYSVDYDCIIIGSDEVFNFAQAAPWGFSPQLHGAIDNVNVNSYAASFGASTYEDILKYGVKNELIKASSNLKHISVRDENSLQIMKRLLPNANIERHLDPVLVGDIPIPEKIEVKIKYILIYAYDFRFDDKDYINEIKKFAQKKGLKIYSVGFYQSWVDKNIVCDPFELLQYFVNAEYVVTDTFHGTIFSVRCHKQFATVFRDKNRQKLSSLLKDLHLESRRLNYAKELEYLLTTSIEYKPVDESLLIERKRTDEYLKRCLFLE